VPVVRVPSLAFEGLPRHWLAGSRVGTALANSVNLLFPAGERFFVRSVHRFLDQIDDETLRAAVRGFEGQEGRHAQAHERLFATLEQQGFVIRPFLARYEELMFRHLEPRLSPELRLSITVALEHYTAVMANNALLPDSPLALAHPEVRRLLEWHATEEIEHKAVAFEVLQRVDPRYSTRLAGMALATAGLIAWWTAGCLTLLRQEPDRRGLWAEFQETQRRNPIGRRVFVRGLKEYLRRDFHPLQRTDDLERARQWLAADAELRQRPVRA
jgi:predicted metal-dependent hydrolase